MDLYNFSWSVSFLCFSCFLFVVLDIPDSLYMVYFSIIYVFIETFLLFLQNFNRR